MRTSNVVAASSVVSLGVGALVAHILTKKHVAAQYEILIEEEIAKAKAFYSQLNKTGEFADPVELAEKLVPDPVLQESEDEDKEYVSYNEIARTYGGQEAPKPTDIQKAVSRPHDHEDMEAYEERLIAESKAEVREVVLRTEETILISEEEEVVRRNVFDDNGRSDDEELDTSTRGDGRPYILTAQEYMDGDEDYNQNTLTYFVADNVLVDSREQPINDARKVIGDDNLKFGLASGDKNIVYVRNDVLEVDFEICRSTGSFAEEVLGFAGPDRGRQNKGLS